MIHSLRIRRSNLVSAAVLILLAGCGGEPAPTSDGPDAAADAADAPAAVAEPTVAAGPPLGRYVCRQYTTTMGYLTLGEGGTYEMAGVEGRYSYDPGTGAMDWQGGSFDEWSWEGAYEHVARPEGDGRPDEDIIRLHSEADGLRVDCYLMTEE